LHSVRTLYCIVMLSTELFVQSETSIVL